MASGWNLLVWLVCVAPLCSFLKCFFSFLLLILIEAHVAALDPNLITVL